MNEEQKLTDMGRTALLAGDYDLASFYIGLARDLKELRLVGKVVAGLYQRTSDPDVWDALYEALDAAGLLTDDQAEDEVQP